jgi:hypothetical protein
MAAAVVVKPDKRSICQDDQDYPNGRDRPSVGSKIAARLNSLSVASIPRVRPRSLFAARAARYASSTVVASDVMNLQHQFQRCQS